MKFDHGTLYHQVLKVSTKGDFSGSLVSSFSAWPHSCCEKYYLYILVEFPVMQLAAIVSCLLTVHIWEESGPVFSIAFFS